MKFGSRSRARRKLSDRPLVDLGHGEIVGLARVGRSQLDMGADIARVEGDRPLEKDDGALETLVGLEPLVEKALRQSLERSHDLGVGGRDAPGRVVGKQRGLETLGDPVLQVEDLADPPVLLRGRLVALRSPHRAPRR